MSADPEVDVVLTTGGTGFTGRDVTPEAVEPMFTKRMDGFSTLFHRISFEKIGVSTIQSRATAGLVGTTFVFALPGSPGACRDAWDGILAHQLDYQGPALQLRRDHAAARRAPAAARRPERARHARMAAAVGSVRAGRAWRTTSAKLAQRASARRARGRMTPTTGASDGKPAGEARRGFAQQHRAALV